MNADEAPLYNHDYVAIFNQTGFNICSLRILGTKILDNLQEVQSVSHLSSLIEIVPAITDIFRQQGIKSKAQGAAQGAKPNAALRAHFSSLSSLQTPLSARAVSMFSKESPPERLVFQSSNIERWRIFTNSDTLEGVI